MDDENVKSEEKIEEKSHADIKAAAASNDAISDDKVAEVKKEIKNDVTSEEASEDKNNSNTSEKDLSGAKVNNTSAYKSKKFDPKIKKIIAAVLLGIICFGAGAATDRVFVRYELKDGRNQMRQNMPGNFKGNRDFNQGQNNNQNSNNTTQAPSSGQPQN